MRELDELLGAQKDFIQGIIDRCGMTCPQVKSSPETYYLGRLAMIYQMCKFQLET